jgi:hypothetical protein
MVLAEFIRRFLLQVLPPVWSAPASSDSWAIVSGNTSWNSAERCSPSTCPTELTPVAMPIFPTRAPARFVTGRMIVIELLAAQPIPILDTS